MTYIYSFLFVGFISLIAEIILDNTNLTAGHITTLFVVIGSFLDMFNIYDKLTILVGGGAIIPITSFGHLLSHASLLRTNNDGFIGLFTGMFDLSSAGIIACLVFGVLFSLIFKPKD